MARLVKEDTSLIGKGADAAAVRWDSNPAPGYIAVRGRSGECHVTCDSRSPPLTAHARRGPAVSDAPRTQRGPARRILASRPLLPKGNVAPGAGGGRAGR